MRLLSKRNRLAHDPATGIWSVMVYQKKTGDPVYCRFHRRSRRVATVPASKRVIPMSSIFLDRFRAAQNNCVQLATELWEIVPARRIERAGDSPSVPPTHVAGYFAVDPFWPVCALRSIDNPGHSSFGSRRNITSVGSSASSEPQSVCDGSWAKQESSSRKINGRPIPVLGGLITSVPIPPTWRSVKNVWRHSDLRQTHQETA